MLGKPSGLRSNFFVYLIANKNTEQEDGISFKVSIEQRSDNLEQQVSNVSIRIICRAYSDLRKTI